MTILQWSEYPSVPNFLNKWPPMYCHLLDNVNIKHESGCGKHYIMVTSCFSPADIQTMWWQTGGGLSGVLTDHVPPRSSDRWRLYRRHKDSRVRTLIPCLCFCWSSWKGSLIASTMYTYSRTQEGSQICPTCYCMTQDRILFDCIDGLKLVIKRCIH